MATYLWKGVDRFGSERVERVEADSAREARAKLEIAGFSELRLQANEFISAGVDPDLVMELARPWVQLIRGLIALEEGNVVGAKELFKGAMVELESFRHFSPFLGLVLLTKSYLCLALAGAGNMDSARVIYREVSVFLESAREEELLGRIRTVLAAEEPSRSVAGG